MAIHRAKPLAGTSLNYEVVGGTTAPTSFNKENTIWINTDTTIGEHQFVYTEPTTRTDGSALTSGDVWLQTDIDRAPVSFNAIKKNELIVYPLPPKSWDGSKWRKVAGAIYQNGEATFTYRAEQVLLDSEGNHAGFVFSTATKSAGGSCTFNQNSDGNYEIYVNTDYGYTLGDLKVVVNNNNNEFSTLRILGVVDSCGPRDGGGNGIEVKMHDGSVLSSNIVNYSVLIGEQWTSGNVDMSADISSYSVFTFGFRAHSSWGSGYCRFTINKIWLE